MIGREEYLLTCLSEEASEVVQRASKAIRFGFGSIEQGQKHTNREQLCAELTDLLAVVTMLNDECDLEHTSDQAAIRAKIERVDTYYLQRPA